MSDLYKGKSDLYIAQREESKAHNDLAYYKKQAEAQQEQLKKLLKHKDECVNGMKSAKEMGLTPLHIRELQLLVAHINSIVDAISFKADASQNNLQVAEDAWQNKNECYEKAKEAKKKSKVMPKEDIDINSQKSGCKKKIKSKGIYNSAIPTMANNNSKSRN